MHTPGTARRAAQPCGLCALHLCCSGVSHLFSVAPFAATSAHSLSLLPSLLVSASPAVLPSFYPGLVKTLPFHPWLDRLTNSPYRNQIATCLCTCISVCEWVGGGYGLNLITRSLDRTHPSRLRLLIIGRENRASKTRADHTTTGKLADVCQDVLVSCIYEETPLGTKPLWILPQEDLERPLQISGRIIPLPISPEMDSLRTKGSRWSFRPSACLGSFWARKPFSSWSFCILNVQTKQRFVFRCQSLR